MSRILVICGVSLFNRHLIDDFGVISRCLVLVLLLAQAGTENTEVKPVCFSLFQIAAVTPLSYKHLKERE